MTDEAVFTLRTIDDGIEFEITPAPMSRGSAGCFLVFFLVCSFCIVLSSLRSGPLIIFGAVLVAIALPGWFLGKMKAERDLRSTNTIIAVLADGAMEVGAKRFEPGDIAELNLVNAKGEAAGSARIYAAGGTGVAGGVATAAIGGAALVVGAFNAASSAQAARSYWITARRRSVSTPESLVGGLTYDTGVALMKDIAKALRTV